MWKTVILIVFGWCFSYGISSAQEKMARSTPLHQFMQDNADSTLVFQYTTNWLGPPEIYFLSKKGDTLTCYTYGDLSAQNYKMQGVPKNIRWKMYGVNKYEILSMPMDVNRFFQVYYLKPEVIKQFWAEMIAIKPWSLHDDQIDGAHCPPVKQQGDIIYDNHIYDGGGIELILITKNEMKRLEFYAPDFYEKQCPGRPGRIAILKIADLLDQYF